MLYYIDIAVYPKCLEPEGYQILESHTKNVSKCLLVWEVLSTHQIYLHNVYINNVIDV